MRHLVVRLVLGLGLAGPAGCISAWQMKADRGCVDIAAHYSHPRAICIYDFKSLMCTCAEPAYLEGSVSMSLGDIVQFNACDVLHAMGEL